MTPNDGNLSIFGHNTLIFWPLEHELSIIKQLKQGDARAFEKLFLCYNAKVYNFVAATLYDKRMAEDITQNVFLAVWEHRESIDPDKSFSAYLFTIARNMVFRQTEKMLNAYHYAEKVKERSTELDHTMEEELNSRFLEESVEKLIAKLPDARRKIFEMSRKEGLSNKEIAARLSISEKTVENQITRSIHFLKEHLRQHISMVGLLMFLN